MLILNEPTRSIDVGAKAEVYAIIDQLAQSGIGIIMISSELPESLQMSDRILDRAEANQAIIMAHAGGMIATGAA